MCVCALLFSSLIFHFISWASIKQRPFVLIVFHVFLSANRVYKFTSFFLFRIIFRSFNNIDDGAEIETKVNVLLAVIFCMKLKISGESLLWQHKKDEAEEDGKR